MTYGAVAYGAGPYAGAMPTAPAPVTPSGSANRGRVRVWVSFTGDIFDTPVWTEVTDDVEMSKPFELDRTQSENEDKLAPGTLRLTLRSKDRKYDPTYVDGPYHGLLKPRRPILVTCEVGPVLYALGVFYIKRWPQRHTTSTGITMVPIVAVDLLGLLADLDWQPARPFTLGDPTLGVLGAGNLIAGRYPTVPEERTGARIARLLDRVGIPAAMLNLDPGQSLCAARTVTTDSVLGELELVRWTELGEIYVNATGVLVFLGRHGWSRRSSMRTPQLTLSDDVADTTTGPFTRLVWDAEDVRRVENEVRFDLPDGSSVQARSAGSRTEYGPMTKSWTTLHRRKVTARLLAQWRVDRFATPELRFDEVEIDPDIRPNVLWSSVAGFDLGTCVRVKHQPDGLGDEIDQTCRIVGIKHRIRTLGMVTTWQLAPADPTPYFTLGDPVLGVLGAGNKVAP